MAWPRFHSERAEPQGAKQMAAPAEPRTPNMHRAKRIAPRECGWKHGDSGHSAGREKPCPTKKRKNRLDSDRPSHGRPYRKRALFLRLFSVSMSDIYRQSTPFIQSGLEVFGPTSTVVFDSCRLPSRPALLISESSSGEN